MREADILKLIRQAVRQELAPILLGQVTDSVDATRVTVSRFITDSPIENLRNIQPYGFASRPPDGMPGVAVPVAGDPTNQMVMGNFDSARPALQKGEVALYGPAGQMLMFKLDGGTYTGDAAGPSEPVVLGNILAKTITMIVNAFAQAATIGVDSLGGPVQLSPAIIQQLQQYLQQYVQDPDTNFLSQKNFVERA